VSTTRLQLARLSGHPLVLKVLARDLDAKARRFALVTLVLSIAAPIGAIADEPPLPPPRPPELGASAKTPEAPPVQAPAPAAPTGDAASTCLAKLIAGGASAEAEPAPETSVEGCGIDAPVRLSSITVAGADVVGLPDRPLVACEFALALADYVRLIVAPVGQTMLRAKVAGIETGPGYSCRTQDRIAGAKISAHGHGLAVDFIAISLADKRPLAAGSAPSWVRAPIRSTPTTCTSTSNSMVQAEAIAFASNSTHTVDRSRLCRRKKAGVRLHIARDHCRTTNSPS
jgi:hypothetical protein